MKKIVYVLITAAFGLTGMGSALACDPATFDLYTCGGATFADGYTAHVELVSPWESCQFHAEDDIDGTCKGKKVDGFACTPSGNLISSRIDDDVKLRAFDDCVTNTTLDLDVSAAGDPFYAVVHANIFDPGTCASSFLCNFYGIDQGGDGIVDDTGNDR